MPVSHICPQSFNDWPLFKELYIISVNLSWEKWKVKSFFILDYLKHFQSLLDSKIRKISTHLLIQKGKKKGSIWTNFNALHINRPKNLWRGKILLFLSTKKKRKDIWNSGKLMELDLILIARKVLELPIRMNQDQEKMFPVVIVRVEKATL